MHTVKYQTFLLQSNLSPLSLICNKKKEMTLSHHGRSLIFPSKSHPSASQFDENLSRVKSSESTSSSLSSFENRIDGLSNLYGNLEDLLLLPHVQQIISQDSQEKWIDQLLNVHIRLLYSCRTVKDLLSDMKHQVEEFLSALRRKDIRGVQFYLTSRRKSKKMVQKSLKELRSARINALPLDTENEEMSMLKEAESVTICMLESLLSYMMGSKKSSSWTLVSKLLNSKQVSCETTDVNEFKKVNGFLQMIQDDDSKTNELMNYLKEIDSNAQILEEKLECFFRHLIKTRVSLLNILNH